MTDKTAEKIAALLRKAESTDSPHEAEALTAAAEKLMVKHGIERAMLDLDPKHKQEHIVEKRFEITGPKHIRDAKVDIVHQVTMALGIRSYYIPPGRSKITRTYLVGFESDVADAETLLNSLMLQADFALSVWWRELPAEDRRVGYDRMLMHRDFYRGFALGVSSRIREARRAAVADAVAEAQAIGAGPGAELVLVDRKKKLDEHMSGMGLTTTRSGGGRSSVDAGLAGHVAGQNANTGENAIGRGRGIAQ